MQSSSSGLHPLVEVLDFERLKWKVVNESKEMTNELAEIAEREYKRFLTISLLYPDVGLSPTLLMDIMWHAHILDTVNYMTDCKSLFGKYMHHNPNFGPHSTPEVKTQIRDSTETTMKLYNQLFNEDAVVSSDEHGRCDRCSSPDYCNKEPCASG